MNACNDNLPTLKARAFQEVKAQLQLRGEASACTIFEATRSALGIPEELCGGEILDAMCVAVRQGLVGCNTFDGAAGSIRIGQQTVLTPTFPVFQ